jgi:hydrogenase nickel incorporation protein HypA/HybF
MHEMAIIQGMLDIVESEAREHQSPRVEKIKLLIGEFAGVVREALEFAFEVARQGTLAQDAELEIEIVPLRKRCNVCGSDRISGGFDLLCEKCLSPVEIVAGREMRIDYIDLAERGADAVPQRAESWIPKTD